MKPVHFSTLRQMRLSPAHAKFTYDGAETPATSSMQVGTAAHSLSFGTGKRVVTFEGRRDKRTEAYKNFLAEHQNDCILSPPEFAAASGMAWALKHNASALYYLEGLREVPMSWDFLGRKCATRGIDVVDDAAIGSGVRFITELKTTKCAKPEWFIGEVLRRHYAAQLCWYEQALGIDVPELVIVAVESAPPHPVVVFKLTDRLREQAQKQLRLWMEQWLVCEQSGHWPGYAQSVVELDVRDDAELDFSGVEETEEAVGF